MRHGVKIFSGFRARGFLIKRTIRAKQFLLTSQYRYPYSTFFDPAECKEENALIIPPTCVNEFFKHSKLKTILPLVGGPPEKQSDEGKLTSEPKYEHEHFERMWSVFRPSTDSLMSKGRRLLNCMLAEESIRKKISNNSKSEKLLHELQEHTNFGEAESSFNMKYMLPPQYKDLLERLSDNPCQTIILEGISGVGKSALAKYLAKRYLAAYFQVRKNTDKLPVIWFFKAETSKEIWASTCDLAKTLGITLPDLKPNLKEDGQPETNQEWMSRCKKERMKFLDTIRKEIINTSIMWIFDNAWQDKQAEDGYPTLSDYRMKLGRASLAGTQHIWQIITTQNNALIAHEHEHVKINLDEGIGALCAHQLFEYHYYNDRAVKPAEAQDLQDREILLRIVDYLPLSIILAARYIHDADISCRMYINLYQNNKEELEKKLASIAKNREHRTQIASVQLSIDKLWSAPVGKQAVYLLLYCSFLSPDSIPEKLLLSFVRKMQLNSNVADFDDQLNLLKSSFLLKQIGRDNGKRYCMHRLVGQTIMDHLKVAQDIQFGDKIAGALLEAYNDNGSQVLIAREAIPHYLRFFSEVTNGNLTLSYDTNHLLMRTLMAYFVSANIRLTKVHDDILLGSPEAELLLGLAWFSGWYDDKHGLEYLHKSAARGFSDAQFALGHVYYQGIKIEKDLEEAVRFYKLAADQGNAAAQVILGMHYEHGIGIEKDTAEAVRWYKLAAAQGNAAAQVNLGINYEHGTGVEKDTAEAVCWYKLAADQGDAAAQINLGIHYEHGTGIEKDTAEAVRLYKLAADQGDAAAQVNLGIHYEYGTGVEKDTAEAVRLYKLAATQGNAAAQVNLGMHYEHGIGAEKNSVEAVCLYKLAADQGNAVAQVNLGIHYEHGIEVEKNTAEAIRLYKLAADQGNAAAQVNLGIHYENGTEIEKDTAEAVRWYKLAATQGDAAAQVNLGINYEHGIGVKKDPAEAVRWYKLAADQGNAAAQKCLGVCYEHGTEVEKDPAEAVRWYKLAADQGNAAAQVNLGIHYEYGIGVEKDTIEAVRWYKLAADQGDTAAQEYLNICYEHGTEVEQDPAETVRLYKLAEADQGNESAQSNLKQCIAEVERSENHVVSATALNAYPGRFLAQAERMTSISVEGTTEATVAEKVEKADSVTSMPFGRT